MAVETPPPYLGLLDSHLLSNFSTFCAVIFFSESVSVSMLVKEAQSNTLVKVLQPEDLINPMKRSVEGRLQAGEEEQPPKRFEKSELIFPSGESLPQCWTDVNYRPAQ